MQEQKSVSQPPAAQQSPLLVLRLIWAALIFSTFSYFMALSSMTKSDEADNKLLLPMAVAAGIALVASFVLPGFLLRGSKARLGQNFDLKAAITIYTKPFILRLVLAESCCTFGFVAALGGGAELYHPFWAAGALAMLLAFPTEDGVLTAVRNG